MKYRQIFFLVFGLSLFGFIQHVNSQTDEIDYSSLINSNTGLPEEVVEQVSIEQIPKIPKPGEGISIRLTSYSTDLNKAKISWTQDGKQVNSGQGATTGVFQAPESGKSSTISITITKEGGGVISKRIILNPADVDLFYEAKTYAHPFYKGKRLYTSESEMDLIAIPNFTKSNGVRIPSNELVYTWKINGVVNEAVSGYGKNKISMKGDLIERPSTIEVDVSAVNSTLTATKSMYITATVPELLTYENNPLLGVVYEKAIIGNFKLERPRVDFEGIPYFFSGLIKNDSSLLYSWFINGLKVETKGPNENYLILQNTEEGEGKAFISAKVEHSQNILQITGSQFLLDFSSKEKTSTNETFSF